MIQKIDKLLAEYGCLPLTDVGIPSPSKPTPQTILSHILNALLSSAHISHHIARRALLNLMKQGYYDLETLKASTWKERVALLDEAGYARYDFSTATELGKLATLVKNKYGNVPLRILHRPQFPACICAARQDLARGTDIRLHIRIGHIKDIAS
jgi:hypothetical protein